MYICVCGRPVQVERAGVTSLRAVLDALRLYGSQVERTWWAIGQAALWPPLSPLLCKASSDMSSSQGFSLSPLRCEASSDATSGQAAAAIALRGEAATENQSSSIAWSLLRAALPKQRSASPSRREPSRRGQKRLCCPTDAYQALCCTDGRRWPARVGQDAADAGQPYRPCHLRHRSQSADLGQHDVQCRRHYRYAGAGARRSNSVKDAQRARSCRRIGWRRGPCAWQETWRRISGAIRNSGRSL